MTNYQLIAQTCIDENVFSVEMVTDYLSRGIELPIHTFKVWKDMGFSVRKGEHARIKMPLWKMTESRTEETEETESRFFMKECHLFTEDQVEPIKITR